MAEEDNDLLRWILGSQPTPQHLQTPLFERLTSYKPDFEEIAERFGLTK
jgi:antitoxin CptB